MSRWAILIAQILAKQTIFTNNETPLHLIKYPRVKNFQQVVEVAQNTFRDSL